MNPSLQITIRTFTTWIMAAVINGILSGASVTIMGNQFYDMPSCIFLCGIISLVFAIPGFFIFWIIMLARVNNKIGGQALFSSALSAALILSAITAVVSSGLFNGISSSARYMFPAFIIISAMSNVMMHSRFFKNIPNKNITDQ